MYTNLKLLNHYTWCGDFFMQKGGIKLEVKINKEICDYMESLFFGLSLRQFIFSLVAMFVAVGIYFGLQPVLGLETTSWVCVLGASPFAEHMFRVSEVLVMKSKILWKVPP